MRSTVAHQIRCQDCDQPMRWDSSGMSWEGDLEVSNHRYRCEGCRSSATVTYRTCHPRSSTDRRPSMSTDPATGQEQTPLDPAEVMAKHEYHIPVTAKGLASGGGWFCGKTCVVPVKEHCLIYRLAAELAAGQEREVDAWNAACDWLASRNFGEMNQQHYAKALLDAWNANPYRAALAGEGVADQPQGECVHPRVNRSELEAESQSCPDCGRTVA